MRNIKFKEFKQQFRHNGRFFLGSNKVMQVALGRSDSDEIRSGTYKVSKLLTGNAGLLVTDMPKEEVERYLSIGCSTLFFISFALVKTTEQLYPYLFVLTVCNAFSGCIAAYITDFSIFTYVFGRIWKAENRTEQPDNRLTRTEIEFGPIWNKIFSNRISKKPNKPIRTTRFFHKSRAITNCNFQLSSLNQRKGQSEILRFFYSRRFLVFSCIVNLFDSSIILFLMGSVMSLSCSKRKATGQDVESESRKRRKICSTTDDDENCRVIPSPKEVTSTELVFDFKTYNSKWKIGECGLLMMKT